MLTTSFDSGMCQNQELLDWVRKQTVITPSSITSRREPRKWPQMAVLRNFGLGLRRPKREPRTPAWPAASTITSARMNCVGVPPAEGGLPPRTPTAPSASQTTSSTRAPRRTSTPFFAALSSRNWSNLERSTCQVRLHSRGSCRVNKNGDDSLPLLLTNCTPTFSTNGPCFRPSSTPSRSNTQYVSGISDSPTLRLGSKSRSSRSTRYPASATNAAVVDPLGPPPITMQSYSVDDVFMILRNSSSHSAHRDHR